ncbi:MAG: NfeD family protein [Spirochaetes bacterium]|nr:MAG: NfeD family protein [Spirochaetota bacterium]
MQLAPLTWAALGIILMALEIIVPGFVIFWFGAGALITALLVFLGLFTQAEWQWLCFMVSSLAFLALWHLELKKHFKSQTDNDFRDPTLTGLAGRVTKPISPSIPGEVELYDNFHGLKKWVAESSGRLDAGQEIIVVEARGIKLVVKPK